MNIDTRNRQLEALSIADGIAMRLRQIVNGASTDNRTACEYGDMARTLKDIEDRLYRTGEYAPENIGSVRGGAQ